MNNVDCIELLQAAATDLLKEDIDPAFVMSPLSDMLVKIAYDDPQTAPLALDALAAVASAAAKATHAGGRRKPFAFDQFRTG